MRKVRVRKFGGTSVGNGERIQHVARIHSIRKEAA
jgi:aspartokinase